MNLLNKKEKDNVVVQETKNKPLIYKVLSIIGNVILYIIFGLGIISLVFTIMSKKSGGEGVNVFGHQFMTVLTASMDKCDETDVSSFEIKDIPPKSLICIENVPENKEEQDKWYQAVKVGDVLTFKYMYFEQEIITHRVVEIKKNVDAGYKIVLEGDNKASGTAAGQQVIDTGEENSFNYVIGKVVWSNLALGTIFASLKTPVGMSLMVIVPCAIIFIYELTKIILIVIKEHKEKVTAKVTAKDAEIEALKARLDAIEKSKADKED